MCVFNNYYLHRSSLVFKIGNEYILSGAKIPCPLAHFVTPENQSVSPE